MLKVNKFDLLVAFYVFLILSADYLGAKTFPLLVIGDFRLNASVAIFLVPFIFTINDVIVEVYGKERAKSVVRASLLMVGLLFLFSWLAVSLPPSARFAGSETAYDSVFSKSMRFSLASLLAFAISEFTDIAVFSRIRERMKGRALWLRNNASNFSAQFLDTVVFITLAFYSLSRPLGDNATFLWSLILPYWLLKCLMSVIETPFVYWGIKWLRKDVVSGPKI
jgi:hypothetical protein